MTEKTTECSEILKVLADETRLAVVQQLMKKPKQVNEMNEELQIEQSLLSHHLKVLREAGIVDTQRNGKAVLYSLASGFEAHRKGQTINLGCCKLVFD